MLKYSFHLTNGVIYKMSEAFKVLNNIRTLRAQSREIALEALEEILEKLTTVVEDRREEESSIRQEQEQRQSKLEAIRAQLIADGIDPEELIAGHQGTSTKQKPARSARPAKYKYTDENGIEKTWTGQGRTPKAIAAAIDGGNLLEDFEIK